jgi:hypothetical protein
MADLLIVSIKEHRVYIFMSVYLLKMVKLMKMMKG